MKRQRVSLAHDILRVVKIPTGVADGGQVSREKEQELWSQADM